MKNNLKCLSALCLMLACSSTVVLSVAKKSVAKKPAVMSSDRMSKQAGTNLRNALKAGKSDAEIVTLYEAYFGPMRNRPSGKNLHDSLIVYATRTAKDKLPLLKSLGEEYFGVLITRGPVTKKVTMVEKPARDDYQSELTALVEILRDKPTPDIVRNIKVRGQRIITEANRANAVISDALIDEFFDFVQEKQGQQRQQQQQQQQQEEPVDEFAGLNKTALEGKLSVLANEAGNVDTDDQGAVQGFVSRLEKGIAAAQGKLSDDELNATGAVDTLNALKA